MTTIIDAAGERAGRPPRETIAVVVVVLYAAAATIAGALGLLAAVSASLQIRMEEGPRAVSQYCVPRLTARRHIGCIAGMAKARASIDRWR